MLTSIATFSYGVAGVAYLVLCALLLTAWRGRTLGSVLTLACLASLVWAGIGAWQASQGDLASGWMDLFEALRNAAWTAFLLLLLGQVRQADGRLTKPAKLIIALYVGYVLLLGLRLLSIDLDGLLGLMPGVMARMGFAVIGMLLVEHVYRSKAQQERWAIKFACLGLGGMFVFDFYLYSDAALFRDLNPEIWSARGLVDALTVPLIAVSVARSATWSNAISVSRRLLFHSAALVGSAIYLLAMGSAGYVLRYFGGRWGSLMQVTFLFGAVILLAVILFSGSFRAWLKVFISKHFYSYNYDYREEWLRFTRTLSVEGADLGERALQAVAELVESPGGALWLKRDSGQCEPASQLHIALPTVGEPADGPLCQFLETRQWVIDLQEYRDAPGLYGDLVLPDWLQRFPRAWLVVPLILQGRLFGFMLLLEPRSAIKLNWEVIDLLKIAGSQAASYLAQREAATALMLARQFESFNRMSTFVVHDLKNLVSQLSLLSTNAEKHKDNPEFQRDMIETVGLSVQKMKLMLQKLARQGAPERLAPLSLDQVVQQAVALKAPFEPRPVLQIIDAGLQVMADRERLERVVGHLIQNAIEATPKDGTVTVKLARSGAQVVIEIADTGTGMSEEFIRERLFKPFDSTKSAGMGIGAFESREYVTEIGGRLDVHSQPERGTTFRMVLPLAAQDKHNIDKAA